MVKPETSSVAKPDPELFRLMADQVRDYAIFLLDPEGRVASWNAGAHSTKQYAADEIIGKHFSIFYTQEDRARAWPATELQRALTEGRCEDRGWRVRKDGSRFWASVTITALRGEDGTLLGFSKITRDMTEQKNAEEQLRQSEERFRLMVDGVIDYAIYMLDVDGLITSWNSGARRIKGYDAAEVIGIHVSKFYSAEDVAAGKPWHELAIARQQGRAEDEGWRVRKDGTRFWARVVVTALYDQEGRLRGYAKVTQDLTQRQHSESLEIAARRIHEFIAVLAHELRNPLAPIRNISQIMKQKKSTDANEQRMFDIVERQTGLLTRIVDDLLDVSRVTRGTMELKKLPLDVTALLERTVDACRSLMQEHGHTLTVSLPSRSVVVNADELRISQAVTNLLSNAARYTPRGGKVWLGAELDPNGRRIAISVRDNGTGIRREMLGSIFGMFVQGENRDYGGGGGLGIGLALSRAIAGLHEGTLEARSAGLGKGSEFILRLPVVNGVPTAESAASHTHGDAPMPRRVLIVDDNRDAARALAHVLERLGHTAEVVHDGQGALEAAEHFRPEVVLLDLGMPGMDGLEVARRLRERRRDPEPVIVAVTGWGKAEDQQKTHEAGFDLHLVKPVEERALRDVMLMEAPAQ
jgi:PAS domain S-box-containing protein